MSFFGKNKKSEEISGEDEEEEEEEEEEDNEDKVYSYEYECDNCQNSCDHEIPKGTIVEDFLKSMKCDECDCLIIQKDKTHINNKW